MIELEMKMKMDNERGRSYVNSYNLPRTTALSCMVVPPTVGNFVINSGVIQLLPKSHGLDSESAYLHLKEFEEVLTMLGRTLSNLGYSPSL